ncbi:QueT transporter family protein [Coprothermobacteraceae bacterium]|nr:QueT transporter family protein [Coprothermobacteraceae bacterium]
MHTTKGSAEQRQNADGWLIRISRAGLLAALYFVLTFVSNMFNLAFGPVQFRISEALVMLPLVWGEAIAAVTLGTFLANLASPYGVLDWGFGTLATLIAAILVRWCATQRYAEWLAALAIAIVNAAFVPFIILAGMGLDWRQVISSPLGVTYWSYAGSIFLGEFGVAVLLGIPLVRSIKRRVLK